MCSIGNYLREYMLSFNKFFARPSTELADTTQMYHTRFVLSNTPPFLTYDENFLRLYSKCQQTARMKRFIHAFCSIDERRRRIEQKLKKLSCICSINFFTLPNAPIHSIYHDFFSHIKFVKTNFYRINLDYLKNGDVMWRFHLQQ